MHSLFFNLAFIFSRLLWKVPLQIHILIHVQLIFNLTGLKLRLCLDQHILISFLLLIIYLFMGPQVLILFCTLVNLLATQTVLTYLMIITGLAWALFKDIIVLQIRIIGIEIIFLILLWVLLWPIENVVHRLACAFPPTWFTMDHRLHHLWSLGISVTHYII